MTKVTEEYTIEQLKNEGKKITAATVSMKLKELGDEWSAVPVTNSNVEIYTRRNKGGRQIVVRNNKND